MRLRQRITPAWHRGKTCGKGQPMHPVPASPRRRRPCVATLPLLAFLLLAACREAAPPPVIEAPRVVTAPVVGVDLEERIEVTGQLEAKLQTVVSAEVGGKLTQALVDEGAPVDKDTIVLEIDPQRRKLELDSARAQVAQTEASLAQQRRQADRVRALQGKGLTSALQLEQADLELALAESRLTAARAQFEIARQALDDATVRAPFTGVTGRRHVNLGQFLQVGTPLMEFVSLDPIEVVFHVAEIDSALVRHGQTVDVRVAPYPSESFEAVVDVIYPQMEAQSRTLRVKATLPNPTGRLRPGLFARADLGVAFRKGVPMVPDEAVLQRADGAVVFLLAGENRVARRQVKIGVFHEGLVEILDGVKPGEVVVTRGHMDLVDGSVVQVVDGGPRTVDVAAETGVVE
jgi:membrane fusion protein (multidrug efflux system)